MSRLSRLPISESLAAALLLAGGVWLLPSIARASCGHYITSTRFAEGASALGFERLHSLAAPTDTTRNPAFPGPPTSPCAGLRCSKDRPAPVPTPQVEPRVEQWGCLHILAFSLRVPSALLPFEDDCPPASDRADRLARPPR